MPWIRLIDQQGGEQRVRITSVLQVQLLLPVEFCLRTNDRPRIFFIYRLGKLTIIMTSESLVDDGT